MTSVLAYENIRLLFSPSSECVCMCEMTLKQQLPYRENIFYLKYVVSSGNLTLDYEKNVNFSIFKSSTSLQRKKKTSWLAHYGFLMNLQVYVTNQSQKQYMTYTHIIKDNG